MPVYKEKNGKAWYVKYSTTDHVTGKTKQILKRGFKKKGEAKQWEVENRSSPDVKHTGVTFDEMLEIYLKSIDSSETSSYMKKIWINKHFPLHTSPIQRITRPMLIEWRNDLEETKLATRTKNRGLQYVKAVFDFAEKIYGIPNPAVVVKAYELKKEDKKEMEVWSPEEFNQFISCVDLFTYKAFYTFLYYTGCRRGEALALCKEDISEDGYVHIHRSIRHYKNGFTPLKTDSSERTIKIDSATFEMIKPLIERADPFVFGCTRSLPITIVDKYFRNGIKTSGVKRIRIHDLRHSHATWLINNGINIVAVSKRLGHSTINQTLKTYAHLVDKTNDEMMDFIEQNRTAA